MKIVFMGTPDFAVPSLKKLHEKHEVVGVVTAPDRPAGRGKKLRPSAVKLTAEELHLPVLQPEKLKSQEFIDQLSSLEAELFVVVAFRMLPEVVWSMPPKGTINLHGSLLPQYRGAAPINRAIMNGEKETGLTTFFINENIDTGAIIDSVKCSIGPNETAGELHDKMMVLGADLLVKTIGKIAKDEAASIPQPESGELKNAPKIFKDDCKIDWQGSAAEIHNHIRGLSPYPAAFTSVEGADFDRMKIFRTEITSEAAQSPGTVMVKDGFLFADAKDRKLKVLDLQVPGKKRMSSSVFLNGFTPPENFKLI